MTNVTILVVAGTLIGVGGAALMDIWSLVLHRRFGIPTLDYAIWGLDWVRSRTLLPALLVGLGTIVAPWFVMQPAMGAGFAGSRTPNPGATRLRNLGTHAVYGFGLYLSAVAVSLLQI